MLMIAASHVPWLAGIFVAAGVGCLALGFEVHAGTLFGIAGTLVTVKQASS